MEQVNWLERAKMNYELAADAETHGDERTMRLHLLASRAAAAIAAADDQRRAQERAEAFLRTTLEASGIDVDRVLGPVGAC